MKVYRDENNISPGDTDRAAVSVPVVTISPVWTGQKSRLRFQHLGEVHEREQRGVEYVRAATGSLLPAVSRQGDGEVAQLRDAVVDVANRDRRAHDQGTVQPEGGDRVYASELPVGVEALNDLEPVRDPVDAVEKTSSSRVTGGVRAKCSWISGSMRGWRRRPIARCARPCGTWCTVES